MFYIIGWHQIDLIIWYQNMFMQAANRILGFIAYA